MPSENYLPDDSYTCEACREKFPIEEMACVGPPDPNHELVTYNPILDHDPFIQIISLCKGCEEKGL